MSFPICSTAVTPLSHMNLLQSHELNRSSTAQNAQLINRGAASGQRQSMAVQTSANRPPMLPAERPSEPSAVLCQILPTSRPLVQPTNRSLVQPTSRPQAQPTNRPQVQPTNRPQVLPTNRPLVLPTNRPLVLPTRRPLVLPTSRPLVSQSSVLQENIPPHHIYTLSTNRQTSNGYRPVQPFNKSAHQFRQLPAPRINRSLFPNAFESPALNSSHSNGLDSRIVKSEFAGAVSSFHTSQNFRNGINIRFPLVNLLSSSQRIPPPPPPLPSRILSNLSTSFSSTTQHPESSPSPLASSSTASSLSTADSIDISVSDSHSQHFPAEGFTKQV